MDLVGMQVKALDFEINSGLVKSGRDTSFQSNIKCDLCIRKDFFVRQYPVAMRHEHVPRDFEEHDEGIDSVVSIHDDIKVVAPPV